MLDNKSFNNIHILPYILYKDYLINNCKDGYAMCDFTYYSRVLNRFIKIFLSLSFNIYFKYSRRCLVLKN